MSWERVRSIRLHPIRAVLAVTLVCLVVTSAFAQTPAEISVRATRAAEHQPAANDGFVGWQSATREHPHRFNAYIKPTGKALFRVNSAGTQGAMGGIDGTTLVYQEYRFDPDLSDLKLFDLATRTRSDPPTGVNTVRWEYHPSLSGDWLLFGRVRLSDGYRTVVLHNLVTGEERVLASAQSAYLGPGQINANYAVWEKCTRRECDVLRYDIIADASRRIPNPVDFQYAPAVTSSGTMYFVRHGPLCASRAKIFRRNLGSDSELMTTIRSGRNVTELFADPSSTGDVGIYYERFVLTDTCRRPLGRSDIYKVVDEGPITSASSSSQSTARLLRGESSSARYSPKYQERNQSSRGFDLGS